VKEGLTKEMKIKESVHSHLVKSIFVFRSLALAWQEKIKLSRNLEKVVREANFIILSKDCNRFISFLSLSLVLF
jgi:hypothetical protein